MFDPTRFICIDFEASSLFRNSWPIEVGLAWTDGTTTTSWSSLIRPEPDWNMDAWSTDSAAIQNIRLEWLHDAPNARDVAESMVARIGDRTVLSDAPEFDQVWLDRLLATMEAPPDIVLKIEDLIFRHPEVDPMRYFGYRDRHDGEHTHRAGADAALMARCLKAAMHA